MFIFQDFTLYDHFFSLQDYEYYIGQFFWVLFFLNVEKKDLMMKFNSYLSEMAFVFETMVIKLTNFNFLSHWRQWILKELQQQVFILRRFCIFRTGSFMNWCNIQFSSESCALYMHFMWFSMNQYFYREFV